MGGIASRNQLRMSFLRQVVVAVPLLLALGFLSGRSVPAGADNGWYVALAKPAVTPPDWVFPIAWTALYILLGVALAMILDARGARGRGWAVALFAVSFGLGLVWQPSFFGAHRIDIALVVTVGMVVFGIAAAFAFGRIRPAAAWLLVPYLVWISFAGVLTWRIGQMNPAADRLAPGAHTSQML